MDSRIKFLWNDVFKMYKIKLKIKIRNRKLFLSCGREFLKEFFGGEEWLEKFLLF